jgi:hypothetical protein
MRADLSALRLRRAGDDADRCLPIFLRVPELQDAAASEVGRLLRVLFVRFNEMSADSGTTWMLRRTGLIGAAAAILSVASGCTWQQLGYFAGQQWQRDACYRLVEQTERERCLSNANMSYEDYRRQTGGAK